MKILSVGEVVIDFIPGNEKGSYIPCIGGAPANVAVALARNGIQANFIGKVGKDQFGKMILDMFNNENVVYPKDIETDIAVTTLVFVHLDDKGERSFTFARKPGADTMLKAEEVKQEMIEDMDMILAGSCSLSEKPASEATYKALQIAKSQGKIVAFDINYRNLLWNDDSKRAQEAVIKAFNYIDILKLSEEELFMIEPFNKISDFIKHYGIKMVVLTKGANGASCYYNDSCINLPGYKANVVDTTGAGDAFFGAFLASLSDVVDLSDSKVLDELNNEVITQALDSGNIAGYLCVGKKGAIDALPTKDEIIAMKQIIEV